MIEINIVFSHFLGTKALENITETGKISGRRGKNVPQEMILGRLRRWYAGVSPIELSQNTRAICGERNHGSQCRLTRHTMMRLNGCSMPALGVSSMLAGVGGGEEPSFSIYIEFAVFTLSRYLSLSAPPPQIQSQNINFVAVSSNSSFFLSSASCFAELWFYRRKT